ncbi:MAG: hypothetical protein J0M12_08435, partial [Deltaproteobacteria bacterium]|nr:hypothetical protein [Deltaproteobacteria bacterium]
LAVWICRRRGLLEGLLGAVVFSFSFVLVLYGSEARGYSSLLFFSLLCFALFESYRERPSLNLALCFWTSALLALLSHFTFLHFYAALLVWSFLLWRREGKPTGRDWVFLHGVPIVLSLMSLGILFTKLQIAGGPQGSRLEVLINALSVPYGGTELSLANLDAGVLSLGLAALLFCILLGEVIRQIRAGQSEGWFYLLMVILVPLVLLVLLRPEVFVLRYVLLSIFFGYFVFIQFLAHLLRRDMVGRILAGVLLGAFILGNANLLGKLLSYGRGQYSEALKFIAKNSLQDEIIIGSDQDFRNSLLVAYYAPRAATGKSFRYRGAQFPNPTEATWVITHTQDPFEVPQPVLSESGLTLAAVFESAPLSGFRWFVYCKESQCPAVVSVN